MSLKVADLLATLGVDASGLDAQIKAATSKAAATVGSEMGKAGETAGKRLTDGLVDSTDDAMSQTAKAIRDGETAASKAAGDVGGSAGKKLDAALEQATVDLGSDIADRLKANTVDLDQRAKTTGGDAGDRLTDALDTATMSVGDGLSDRLKANTSDLETRAKAIGEDTGSGLGTGILNGLPDLEGGLSGALEGAMGGLPVAVAGPALAAGAAAGALIVKGFGDALENGQVNAKLAARLNVDPAQAAQFSRVTSDVWRQNWGESTAEVADAIDAVYSTLDDSHRSEAALERLTKKAVSFATVMDADVGQSVANAGVLIDSGLAKDADHAFDLMTASAQRVPAFLRDELAEATHEYSTFFASLGYSGEEAMGLLVEAAAGGTYAIDKTGDALKELTIRASDLSDTTAMEGLKSLGLIPEEIVPKLLAGGEAARGATRQIVEGLASIEDPGKQASIAVALMGAPLEDLGKAKIPEFVARLADASTELDNVTGAANKLAESNKNVASSWETVKRAFAAGASDWANDMLAPLAGAIEGSWSDAGKGAAKAFWAGIKTSGPGAPIAHAAEGWQKILFGDENPETGRGIGAFLGEKQLEEADAAKAAAEEQSRLATAQEHQARSAERAADSTKIFTTQIGALNLASQDAGFLLDLNRVRADGFRRSLEMSSTMDDQIASALDLSEGYKSFTAVLRDLPANLDVAAIAFDGLAEKPTAAVRQLLDYGRDVQSFLSDTLQFQGEESTRDAAERVRAQLEQTASAAGMSRAQIDELLRVVGVSDEQIEIAIKVSGDDLAITKIQMLKDMLAVPVGANPEFQMFLSTAIAQDDFQSVANLLSAFAEDMTDGSIENPILLALGVDTLPATLMTEEWKADTAGADPATIGVGADTGPASTGLQAWRDYVSATPAVTPVAVATTAATEQFRDWVTAMERRGINVPIRLEQQVLDIKGMRDAGGYGAPYKLGTIEYATGDDLNWNGVVGRAMGGPVTGPKIAPIPGLPASDTVLVATTPGEWVTPTAAVNKLGPEVMARVSAGQLPAAVMPVPVEATGAGSGGLASLQEVSALAGEVRALARAVATKGDTITVTEAVSAQATALEIMAAKVDRAWSAGLL